MYTLKDLALMSGLTDRTLRNYLKTGVLQGEKKDGTWTFTAEQVDDFMQNAYARAAINAGRNAILYDFLHLDNGEKNSACLILNLPEESSASAAEFFCDAVNKRTGLKMTYDCEKGRNKVILVGQEQTVHEIMQEFHHRKKK